VLMAGTPNIDVVLRRTKGVCKYGTLWYQALARV
jgi:hypothetical protein